MISIILTFQENITKNWRKSEIYNKKYIRHFPGGKYKSTEGVPKWFPISRVENNMILNLWTVLEKNIVSNSNEKRRTSVGRSGAHGLEEIMWEKGTKSKKSVYK